ncbi:C2H2-type zinc finger protein CYBJADRAFT_120626, partial [Cyberlindnera jadinii NRRL Y-1542]
RKYRCKICEKCFTTSGHLARHSRIHTGERKHVCPFEGCGAKFARQDNCMQ